MAAKKQNNDENCEFCSQPIHSKDLEKPGNNVGNGGTLGQRIMEDKYSPGKTAQDHPLSMPDRFGYSFAQAHHIICSEVMDTDDWALVCSTFGYDINCVENGVFLPADMRVACELEIPLHRGNHSQTEDGETPGYVALVDELTTSVLGAAMAGEYCDKKDEIIKDLNDISNIIWDNVVNFRWKLTYDGKDYNSKKPGCLSARSLPTKRDIEAKGEIKKCKKNREHGIGLRQSDYFKERK